MTSHADLPPLLFATRLGVGQLALIDILLQENQHGIVAKNQQQYGCHLCEAVIKDGNKFYIRGGSYPSNPRPGPTMWIDHDIVQVADTK